MGKIKNLFYKRSIKTIFIWYMLGCIVTAILFSLLLSNTCQFVQSRIYNKYQTIYEETHKEIEVEKGHLIAYYTRDLRSYFTPFEQRLDDAMSFFGIAVYPICFIICIVGTSVLFYRRQLQTPLAILDHAAGQIADNVSKFSLGMKQRLAIARAISHSPKLLVLDEPINGLDPMGIRQMRELFLTLAKDRGMTILISSHILNEIEYVADRVGVLVNGTIAKEVSISEVRDRNLNGLEDYFFNIMSGGAGE